MNHAKFYLILRKITFCYPTMLGHLVYVNRKGTLAGMYQTRSDDKINFKVKLTNGRLDYPVNTPGVILVNDVIYAFGGSVGNQSSDDFDTAELVDWWQYVDLLSLHNLYSFLIMFCEK